MNKIVKLILVVVIFAFGFTLSSCSDDPKIELNKERSFPGKLMEAKWRVPKTFSKKAWIGTVKAEIPVGEGKQTTEKGASFELLDGKSKGTFKFKAGGVGSWTVRIYDDENGNEVASEPFLSSNDM